MTARRLAMERIWVLLQAAWLRRVRRRAYTVFDDRGPRVLWPWSDWPEGYWDPTPAEIVVMRGWR